MQLIDNINRLLGDDLKGELRANSKLKVAASCFSIYAFEALRAELEKINSFEFIFTAPTFVPTEATDSGTRARREFHIPKATREKDFYGTDFEIQLKNKLTQRAIAKECADWIRRKGRFRSNCTKSPMQGFACVQHAKAAAVYQPLAGFTAVELGYQTGDAVSNFITKVDESPHTDSFLALFDHRPSADHWRVVRHAASASQLGQL